MVRPEVREGTGSEGGNTGPGDGSKDFSLYSSEMGAVGGFDLLYTNHSRPQIKLHTN